jgi:hypothetical protein
VSKNNQLHFWRIVLALTAMLALASIAQLLQVAKNFEIQIFHSSWIILFSAILATVLMVLTLLGLSWTRWQASLLSWTDTFNHHSNQWKVIAAAGMVILPCIFSIAILHPYLGTYYFPGYFTRLALFWCLSLIGMLCAKIIKEELSWVSALGISVLLLAVFYRMAAIFSQVSDYPFARGWSEVSRYYGASLFFSQRLYGQKIPLVLMHPTWHLLLTPPFLLGNMPIWVHRLWQALLQVSLTGVLSLALVKRLRLPHNAMVWLASGWTFLFLMQGPILIHLEVCALIVILGIKPELFWRNIITVLAASLWAGLSRINWFPVPALIAAIIYFMGIPVRNPKQWATYLVKPILWFGIGISMALASNILFVKLSGNGNGSNFVSSLTSDLLWYRLLPNPTYSHGILMDLLLVSMPVILICVFTIRQGRAAFHPIRLIGLAAILAILCVGGLIVSTKIGGGSDLHNLDAFLITLMLAGGYFFFGVSEPEPGNTMPILLTHSRLRFFLLILALTIPVGLAVQYGKVITTWNHSEIESELVTITDQVETVSDNSGKVLFISQRQLLAMKMVKVPLIPEYEQDFLMEMVMSHNRPYLDHFQADLRSQKFAMVVADEQNLHYYGKSGAFGAENDLWVQEVSIPMLCYYRPITQPGDSGVVLYAPRDEPCQ